MDNWVPPVDPEPLFLAIAADDLSGVSDLVDNQGADVNATTSTTERDYTALAWASSNKVASSNLGIRAQIIEFLCLHGANASVGAPALECRDAAGLDILLRYGAVADQTVPIAGVRPATALVSCCDELRADLVEMLLKFGALPDVKLATGISLLYSVCLASLNSPHAKTPAFAIIRLLQRFGGDLEATDRYGRTILSYAVTLYTHDVAGLPKDTPDDLVALLLNMGANVGHREPDASTVLIKAVLNPAARRTNFPMVNLLFAYGAGAYVDIYDRRGLTPLHYLVHFDSEVYDRFAETKELIELMFSRGASVDVRDADGRTAFFRLVAFLCPRPGTVSWHPPPAPNTPSRRYALEILSQLRNGQKADVKLVDHKGQTPLAVAKAAGNMGNDVQGYCY